ncbi:hypothetical protein [Marinobacter sp. HL-58]|uniref:hypothetical protein n=1 Tax=Marinobacter sp. HL-58 TaxID=1479237 RepID=UPI0004870804|nr:hypothetical protein [Marinobacter sp. HL-58]KPP98884.1 MAG: hypothetical protein HLUCCO03_13700 [Marinobacter sp. HL-58]
MTSSASIQLHIANAIPPGNEKETSDIIALWQEVSGFFADKSFSSRSDFRGDVHDYHVTLDAGPLLKALENARTESGSFTEHQQAFIDDAGKIMEGGLIITIASEKQELAEEESYQVATAFIQQLVMATHIACPGSFQILNARFLGENAHLYEAQHFDARIFYGAYKTAIENEWPKLRNLAFGEVWNWLEGTEVSQTYTAIKSIDKSLFTLLKVAEQRNEYSARTALLVMYQIEVLLDCRQFNSLEDVRNRTRLVLGNIPEAADCLQELHEVRNHLFTANQPVHPPMLICHTAERALREQLGQHNSAVESGTALVLKLFQDLVAHGAYRYRFTESFTRD